MKKYLRMSSAAVVMGALRVNYFLIFKAFMAGKIAVNSEDSDQSAHSYNVISLPSSN